MIIYGGKGMIKQEILKEITELKERLSNLEKLYTSLTPPNNRWRADKEDSSTDFKGEIKTLVAKRLDEINHFISGCDSPFTYSQIREVQELMCDIRTTLGIEVEE